MTHASSGPAGHIATNRPASPWRRWPFGESQWRQAIRNSELSSQVQRVLVEVVAGTRLLAAEKLEVAEELVAHFEDGLQRGRGVASMIEAFGDPQIASQLIRNGKQRTRSMKNRLVQGSLWMAGTSGVGFLILVFVFYLGKPEPSVDYLAVINRPVLAAADHDKGWTIYRELWIKHGFSEGGGFDSQALYVPGHEEKSIETLVRPSDGELWLAATRRLAEIEDLLEGFRVGGVRPSFGVPLHIDLTEYSEADFRALFPNRDRQSMSAELKEQFGIEMSGMISMVYMPHVSVMWNAARLLIVDTRWAIEQGDLDRATRNIEAMLGISIQVAENRFLYCSMAGYAINIQALDLIGECLEAQVAFTDQHLERIKIAIANVPLVEMVDIASERAQFMDIVQKSYTDDGQGDGRITPKGLQILKEIEALTIQLNSSPKPPSGWSFPYLTQENLPPTSLLVFASRKQLTDKADEYFRIMDADMKVGASDDDAENAIGHAIRELPEGYVFIKMLLPAFHFARLARVRAQVNSGSVLTALGVIRYQREHGRLPETLNDLVGDFLEQVPQDPFDNLPLRYVPKGDKFVIYSVGVNGVDDGGQVVMRRIGEEWYSFVADPALEENIDELRPLPAGSYDLWNNHNYPGDWILWPRNGVLDE
ncbi:MAG: hypothetical protein Q8M16_11415 [Pirellulaceae bacterium]|nr:hypothetical protein [Pirellulaceae bacterium]